MFCAVVTYNRDDFVAECVASLLREDGSGVAIEVTVINNGATDDTARVLDQIDDPRVTVRTNERNMPLTLVWNAALEVGHASGADYFMILNDDIEMQPGAIAEMVAVCQAEPMSLVTPLQINYRKPEELDGAMRENLQATPELMDDVLLNGAPKRYYHQRTLIGAALLATLETYRTIGDFDPIFTFYGVDDDYSNRARDMGIPRLVAMNARMLHLHGKTTSAPKVSRKDWLRRWATQYQGRAVFEMKDTSRSFRASYIRVMGRIAFDVVRFLFKRFPGGSVTAARTFVFFLKRYGQMARRQAHETELLRAYRGAGS